MEDALDGFASEAVTQWKAEGKIVVNVRKDLCVDVFWHQEFVQKHYQVILSSLLEEG